MHGTLPDGTDLDLADGATGLDAAAAIGPRLAQAAVAVQVNGDVRDLRLPVADGEQLRILTDRDPEALAVLRHSTAHVMAEAVLHLWPDAKIAIGPAIADGFYYDFELPDGGTFSEDDLARIEARMRELAAEDQRFARSEVSVDQGLTLFGDQPYKQEIIRRVGGVDDPTE
ncbi:MAG TPA: TGS domain-containing protein, partial [Gaiellales bacterium]|nr:TGS domain-containing protein [Gaiellales bacterium]